MKCAPARVPDMDEILNTYRTTSDKSPPPLFSPSRLLSVQMNQTPVYMGGPASITTCQLCVISFKNNQLLCVPVPIFCLFSQCTTTSEYTE